jgi:hypothetical protein
VNTEQSRPLLTVVRGEPTDQEIVALTAVIAALSQRRSHRRSTPVGGWADPTVGHRRPLRTGPGAWAATGRAS